MHAACLHLGQHAPCASSVPNSPDQLSRPAAGCCQGHELAFRIGLAPCQESVCRQLLEPFLAIPNPCQPHQASTPYPHTRRAPCSTTGWSCNHTARITRGEAHKQYIVLGHDSPPMAWECRMRLGLAPLRDWHLLPLNATLPPLSPSLSPSLSGPGVWSSVFPPKLRLAMALAPGSTPGIVSYHCACIEAACSRAVSPPKQTAVTTKTHSCKDPSGPAVDSHSST